VVLALIWAKIGAVERERPVTRILRVLELLQTYGRVGGPELAARLEVDPRTVRHYVARLQELGVPVVADRGRAGGYRLRPGYKLPPMMFSDDEALAVTLGLLAVRRFSLLPGGHAVDGALAKLDRVLPATLRERLRAADRTLAFADARPAREPVRDEVLLALSDAVRDRRSVRIGYQSWRGEAGERLVDPYGLVFERGRWYLAAHDHRREAVRVFRVDRVGAVERTRAGFEPAAGFDPVGHVQRSLARVPWRWRVAVLLDLPPEEARQRLPRSVGEVEEHAAGSLLRVRAERLDSVARGLVGLGCGFTVLEPEELRAELSRLGAELAEAAERRPPPA
jgi:predicted DNA-binding transcriptional regulator YafY